MPNRLVKAAMYEHMSALFGGPPNATHLALYTRWAAGGWGMVCTGNVQVCSDHLTLGRDMVVPVSLTAETIEPYAQLARVIHYGSSDGEGKGEPGTLAIMQLSHPGRQSTNVIGGRWPFVPPLAPSAVPVGRVASKGEGYASALLSHLVHTVFFQTPRPMGLSDIENVVSSFVRGAELAAESGFDGVQLHAAHGYLISQFMSPKTNWREDRYGAPDNALRFLREIVCAIREHDKISSNFVLGVKLNAADYVDCRSGGQPAEQQNQALQHVCEIARWGMLDFIEVSGGDYEDPAFLTENKSGRQAFFTEFAREVKQTLASSQASNPPLILLTGGLRTLPRMSSVLDHDYADLLGIGRLSVLCPDLPRTLEAAKTGDFRDNCFPWEPLPEPDLASPTTAHAQHFVSRSLIPLITRCWAGLPVHFPKLVGAGAVMAWYMVMMRRIAANEEVDYSVGGVEAVLRMWLWLAPSSGRHIDGGFIACVLDSWWAMGMLGVFLGLVLGISFNP
ncbi:FMN-linked oxidoreductase [Daedalea quercina L-15889]|uniref:FMN-linked oxidoreductase n=1 Tax=Daedalea quercina L-15889 TaxID=1314783 RepID=A0A165QWN6_9APHY|nr:FMN-linked oxidoreductase [Daedalea quercina L-15889]